MEGGRETASPLGRVTCICRVKSLLHLEATKQPHGIACRLVRLPACRRPQLQSLQAWHAVATFIQHVMDLPAKHEPQCTFSLPLLQQQVEKGRASPQRVSSMHVSPQCSRSVMAVELL